MSPYHYVLIFWLLTLIYGLCRAFYDSGFEVAASQQVKYNVFMLPDGWNGFKMITEPMTPEPVKKEIFEDIDLRIRQSYGVIEANMSLINSVCS